MCIRDSSYSDQIYDKTVNTIRMITPRDVHTHQFKIFFAVQRIGTEATIPVDNGGRGGRVAKIDLDTGILSEARCLHNRNVYKVHPDSKAPIEGAQIPGWDRIKEEVLALANKMPYMHFIAWDIPVSYTHLDVYKRQSIASLTILLSAFSQVFSPNISSSRITSKEDESGPWPSF